MELSVLVFEIFLLFSENQRNAKVGWDLRSPLPRRSLAPAKQDHREQVPQDAR